MVTLKVLKLQKTDEEGKPPKYVLNLTGAAQGVEYGLTLRAQGLSELTRACPTKPGGLIDITLVRTYADITTFKDSIEIAKERSAENLQTALDISARMSNDLMTADEAPPTGPDPVTQGWFESCPSWTTESDRQPIPPDTGDLMDRAKADIYMAGLQAVPYQTPEEAAQTEEILAQIEQDMKARQDLKIPDVKVLIEELENFDYSKPVESTAAVKARMDALGYDTSTLTEDLLGKPADYDDLTSRRRTPTDPEENTDRARDQPEALMARRTAAQKAQHAQEDKDAKEAMRDIKNASKLHL